jgi:HrpA-like RNA helicase
MDNIGILDPEGKNNNPLNNKQYSETYKDLAKKWSNFPAYKIRNEVIDAITNSDVILCIASTGSGKTVLVPKFALHSLNYKGKIAITLPKQIIAKSAAEFSAKTLDIELGKQVGYQYKNAPKESHCRDTKLLYATDGTIVARLMNDITLKDFDMVIIDEAHERKVQIDFIMYLLRQTLRIRKNFKVIIMSATINSNLFREYFSEFKFQEINIEGERLYPIKSIFSKSEMEYKQMLEFGLNIVKELSGEKMSALNGDILFFITSSNEAMDICKKKNNMKDRNKLLCVEVFAGMDDKKQDLAQSNKIYKDNGYTKKLVVATNVAESSLTIDGIKYVIDSGCELNSSYDPILHARLLDRVLISKAQVKQRMGRAGRTEPGTCFHLYTEKQYKDMKDFPEPDIKKVNLAYECLKLLNMNKDKDIKYLLDVLLDFIEPPPEKYIKSALNDLIDLELVVNNKISKLGELVVNIGADDIYSSLAIIYGKLYGCGNDIINITSYISAAKSNMGEILAYPNEIMVSHIKDNGKRKEELSKLYKLFNDKKNKLGSKYGDHISLLNIYNKYSNKISNYDNAIKWAKKYFVKLKTLDKAKKNARNLSKYIKQYDNTINNIELGITINKEVNNMELNKKIIFCLYMANKTKTAQYDGGYITRYNTSAYSLSHLSFINSTKYPKYIFYDELFISAGTGILNIVTKISKKYYEN